MSKADVGEVGNTLYCSQREIMVRIGRRKK
jgi:hypothetical protein